MKLLVPFFLIFSIVFTSCKTDAEKKKQKNTIQEKNVIPKTTYTSFGKKITATNVLSNGDALATYRYLKIGDTIQIKFASKINEICSKKGCWIKIPVGDKEPFVTFKKYGFTLPLNSVGKEIILQGKAYITETSVKDLRHYAKDAGKSKKEITAITMPKKELSFLAEGVLIE